VVFGARTARVFGWATGESGLNIVGAGSFRIPYVKLVQPDGAEYVVQGDYYFRGARSAALGAAEIRARITDDWGDTLAKARARYGREHG
jgi:hypothetical protein